MIHTSKCIKTIFLPEIEKLGFEYKIHDRQTWIFMRKKENIEQYIKIAFFYNNTAIRLYFGTNAYGRDAIDASKVATKEEYQCDIEGMILFDNDEKLMLLLKDFVKICEKYADETLEKISTPISKYWPSEDMQIELYEKHNYFEDHGYTTNQYNNVTKLPTEAQSDVVIVCHWNDENDITAGAHFVALTKYMDSDGRTYYVEHNNDKTAKDRYSSLYQYYKQNKEYGFVSATEIYK